MVASALPSGREVFLENTLKQGSLYKNHKKIYLKCFYWFLYISPFSSFLLPTFPHFYLLLSSFVIEFLTPATLRIFFCFTLFHRKLRQVKCSQSLPIQSKPGLQYHLKGCVQQVTTRCPSDRTVLLMSGHRSYTRSASSCLINQ